MLLLIYGHVTPAQWRDITTHNNICLLPLYLSHSLGVNPSILAVLSVSEEKQDVSDRHCSWACLLLQTWLHHSLSRLPYSFLLPLFSPSTSLAFSLPSHTLLPLLHFPSHSSLPLTPPPPHHIFSTLSSFSMHRCLSSSRTPPFLLFSLSLSLALLFFEWNSTAVNYSTLDYFRLSNGVSVIAYTEKWCETQSGIRRSFASTSRFVCLHKHHSPSISCNK